MLPGNFSLATRFGFGPFYWTPLRLCGYRCVEFWLTQIARMCGEATKLQNPPANGQHWQRVSLQNSTPLLNPTTFGFIKNIIKYFLSTLKIMLN